MKLTEQTIKNTKPNPDKQIKLTDGKGLYLLIAKSGAKYFRLKYRFDGKEKVLALGVYPECSLREAKNKMMEAKLQIDSGIDPASTRKQAKAEKAAKIETIKRIEAGQPLTNSFKEVALNWLDTTSSIVKDA
jgi:Arm DNA-binding domain